MIDNVPDGLDAALEASLRTTWNARVVDYDRERFPFDEWIADCIREHGYPIDSLATLHEVVPTEEAYVLSKDVCAATNRPEFRALLNAFVLEEVAPKGGLQPPIAAQRFTNVRIMLPDKPQGVFPFHTGLLYGHGEGSRSLWMPLTDVRGDEDRTASLQIIDLERSRELIRRAIDDRLSISQMTELFGNESEAIKAGPGQVVFFSQENIHGNYVNRSGKTRVSIDFRLAEGRFGDRLARKIPGGYFELIDDAGGIQPRPNHERLANDRSNIIYLNNNTSSSEGIPAHLQRYMVYDYCKNHGVPYEFELFELERMNHLPTLHHIVGELSCNAILYSIYSLPEDSEDRREVYRAARESGVLLYFVNEALVISDEAGEQQVEDFLAFAKFGPRPL